MSDFNKSVKRAARKALETIHPGMGMSREALKIVTLSLNELNDRMVVECLKGKRKSQAVMPLTVVQKAVDNVFFKKGAMKPHAQAAGNRCILKYNAGLLVYAPKLKVEAKRKIPPMRIFPEFISGVPAFAHLVNSNIIVDTEAKKLVALILQQTAQAVAKKSQETSEGKGDLTITDIIKAVENCMSANMARHAIGEGSKHLLLFRQGCNHYTVEDFGAAKSKHKTKNKTN